MFERYSKKVIESFALKTIGKSYDNRYLEYREPDNSDNFDFISPDGLKALEITTAIPQNELEAYKYEIALSKGKNPSASRVEDVRVDDTNHLVSYHGGSMHEIANLILNGISAKNEKAIKRLSKSKIKSVDLCICIVDGSLFDLKSFQLKFNELHRYLFDNIFFITPSYFIKYDKKNHFQEYQRKIN